MGAPSRMIRALRPFLKERAGTWAALKRADEQLSVLHHSLAERVPALIRPAPRQITIAITAQCNLRCRGCRYGRDFMPGEILPLEKVREVLDDARAAGVNTARFYGGEPLLHPHLPRMIEHARGIGLDAYITTNGTHLARRFDELYRAGLRWMTIGFYGVEDAYDDYTQRTGHFARLRAGIEAVRARAGGEVQIQINFVLSRRSCSLEALHAAWAFARELDLYFSIDPISEVIPFFTNPERDLHLEAEHEAALEQVVGELLRLKAEFPHRLPQSVPLLRALPDLLLRREQVHVPCDAYQLLWVGADGTVQLCDVHFKLGNVHERPLREMLFTDEHRRAARDGFRLRCPDCSCKIDSRIRKHAASLRRYGGLAPAPRA